MQMFSVFLFILLQFADGWRKMHTIWPFTNTDTAPRTVRCCNLIKMCQRGMAAKFLIKWKRCLVESYGSCVSFAWPIVVYANLHITLFVSGTAVHLHQKEEATIRRSFSRTVFFFFVFCSNAWMFYSSAWSVQSCIQVWKGLKAQPANLLIKRKVRVHLFSFWNESSGSSSYCSLILVRYHYCRAQMGHAKRSRDCKF